MHFPALCLAVAVSVTSAVKFGNPNFTGISVGSPFTITWIDASGPVTIELKNGPATALKDVKTIGSSITGTTFSWTPTAPLSDGPYALEITDSAGPNYSVQFEISDSSGSSDVSTGVVASVTSLGSSSSSVMAPVSSSVAIITSSPASTLLSAVSSDIASQSASGPSSRIRSTTTSITHSSAFKMSSTTSSAIATSNTFSNDATLGINHAANIISLLAVVFVGVAGVI